MLPPKKYGNIDMNLKINKNLTMEIGVCRKVVYDSKETLLCQSLDTAISLSHAQT